MEYLITVEKLSAKWIVARRHTTEPAKFLQSNGTWLKSTRPSGEFDSVGHATVVLGKPVIVRQDSCRFYIYSPIGDFLHYDGIWRAGTKNERGESTCFFSSREEAQSLLDLDNEISVKPDWVVETR